MKKIIFCLAAIVILFSSCDNFFRSMEPFIEYATTRTKGVGYHFASPHFRMSSGIYAIEPASGSYTYMTIDVRNPQGWDLNFDFSGIFPFNAFNTITTELLPNRQQVRVGIPNQARLADIDLTMHITTAAGRPMPSYQLPRMQARYLNNNLEALSVNVGGINRLTNFNAANTNYAVNLSSTESAIVITANIPAGKHSSYIIRRAGHSSLGPFTSSSDTISGLPGTSTIFIDVTADSGAIKTYTLTINRQQVLIEMVWINAGSFTMGDDVSWNAQPPHQVTLTQGFWMGRYQVTQGEWAAVMGSNPSYFRPGGGGAAMVSGMDTSNFPVEQVSWYDILVFANRLSILRNLTPVYEMEAAVGGQWTTNPDLWGAVPTSSNPRWDAVRIVPGSTGYRLPTEAQWEFACRAGTTTPWNTGNSITQSQANFWLSGGTNLNRTTTVGSFAPNDWGLYDMHGNVWEPVWDWFAAYPGGDRTDPTGPSSGDNRVRRGGSWHADATTRRAAHRSNVNNPWDRWNADGVRLVRPE